MSQEEGEPQGAHFEGEGDDAGGDKHHMQIDGPSEDGPVDPAAGTVPHRPTAAPPPPHHSTDPISNTLPLHQPTTPPPH